MRIQKNQHKKKVPLFIYIPLALVFCVVVVVAIMTIRNTNDVVPASAFEQGEDGGETETETPVPTDTAPPDSGDLTDMPDEDEPAQAFIIPYNPPPEPDATVYDYVIQNARLINPETNNDIDGINIGIIGGSVASITKGPIIGDITIDATGLIACPGFIDIDSYEPNPLGVKYKLGDGVTTNLLMHSGAANAKTWYENYANKPPLINYGASNHIVRMRQELGYGIYDVINSEADIEKLCQMVENNIQNGALGISVSPEYHPGIRGEELLALGRTAAKYNSCVYYHLRYSTTVEPNTSIKAIEEVIDIARETGVSTHILHITSTGSTYCVDEAFGIVEDARAEGIDLTACLYPYDSWATYLGSTRFDSGWQERFGLTYSDLQLANSSETLTAETFGRYRSENPLVIANGSIPEDELRYALQKPYVFVATDTIIEPSLDDHPRGSGSYARLIGRYARDEKVITLMDAIAKASFLPAKRLESASDDMKKKGRLEIGADADIVLFNYDTIIDKSTNENVAAYSEGIEYVFVNGKLALDPDRRFDVVAGQPVRSYIASPAEIPETKTSGIYLNGVNKGTVELYDIFENSTSFIALSDIAAQTGVTFVNSEDGRLIFGEAELYMGEMEFTSYGQQSNLCHVPVIYRGDIYIQADDAVYLLEGLGIDIP